MFVMAKVKNKYKKLVNLGKYRMPLNWTQIQLTYMRIIFKSNIFFNNQCIFFVTGKQSR